MVFSFVIVEITFSSRSFVFGQSHGDGFCRFSPNYLAVACSIWPCILLPVCPPVCLSLNLKFVNSSLKVANDLCAVAYIVRL